MEENVSATLCIGRINDNRNSEDEMIEAVQGRVSGTG